MIFNFLLLCINLFHLFKSFIFHWNNFANEHYLSLKMFIKYFCLLIFSTKADLITFYKYNKTPQDILNL